MNNFFDISIVGAMWHSVVTDSEDSKIRIRTLSQEAIAELGEEVKSWYESLGAEAQHYVRSVEIHPAQDKRSPDLVHVYIKTCEIGNESSFIHVPGGSESFLYHLETRSSGPSRRERRSLTKSLDEALRSILEERISLMGYLVQDLQNGVAAIGQRTGTVVEKDDED
jgi:hypothetical protein